MSLVRNFTIIMILAISTTGFSAQTPKQTSKKLAPVVFSEPFAKDLRMAVLAFDHDRQVCVVISYDEVQKCAEAISKRAPSFQDKIDTVDAEAKSSPEMEATRCLAQALAKYRQFLMIRYIRLMEIETKNPTLSQAAIALRTSEDMRPQLEAEIRFYAHVSVALTHASTRWLIPCECLNEEEQEKGKPCDQTVLKETPIGNEPSSGQK